MAQLDSETKLAKRCLLEKQCVTHLENVSHEFITKTKRKQSATYLNTMQWRLIMSQYNTSLAPHRSQCTILATIRRERLVASSATLRKFPASLQNHTLVEIFLSILHPSHKGDILTIQR